MIGHLTSGSQPELPGPEPNIAEATPNRQFQVQADPFHSGQAADEGIVIGRLLFDGDFARKHASVIHRGLFDDPVWRKVYETSQEDIREHGEVDVSRVSRLIEAEDPDRANARLADLANYAQFGPLRAEEALRHLIEQRDAVGLADLCGVIRDQIGTPSMSYAKGHGLLDEHLVSCPPYKGGSGHDMTLPVPVPASQLAPGESVDWKWYGYLAAGHTTLLTGLWFSGKSTLIAHLLVAFGRGGDLAGAVTPGRVLVVSEESAMLWKRRVDALGIGDQVKFLIRPFKLLPTQREWASYIEGVGDLVKQDGYSVVIFDVLPHLWPVENENDAPVVLAALTPLRRICEAGAAVLLVHHPRKSEGDQGQAARGSGALPGWVDTSLEFRRFDPQRQDDTRRVLMGRGRFEETPREVVIELGNDGYTTAGTRAESNRRDRLDAIAEVLPDKEPGLTAEEVREEWLPGGIPKPSERVLKRELAHGHTNGRWERTGEGKSGDPFRFLSCQPYIRRATGQETGPATEPDKRGAA